MHVYRLTEMYTEVQYAPKDQDFWPEENSFDGPSSNKLADMLVIIEINMLIY